MKIKSLLFLLFSMNMLAQAPTISGDLMLCPNTNGTATITNDQTYDSYQWYFKYWFSDGDYVAISNATNSSFTYDWYTYDQALFKVVVTLNGVTYESNSIQIDSYNWLPLNITTVLDESTQIDYETGEYLVCNGNTMTFTISSHFTENIIWYKNGIAIEGANAQSYVVTQDGDYTVQASPTVCPSSSNNTSTQPLQVRFRDCTLSTPSNEFEQNITLYPNPTTNFVNVDNRLNTELTYQVYDLNSRLLDTGILENTNSKVNLSQYQTGTYLIVLSNQQNSKSFKIVKK